MSGRLLISFTFIFWFSFGSFLRNMTAYIFLYFDAFNVIPLGLSYERMVYLKRDLKNDISSQLQLGGLSRD